MAWTRFTLDPQNPNQFEEVPCARCGAYLVIHAPDPDVPDRMLGVCSDCHAWYLMHCAEGKMMRLPDSVGETTRKGSRKGTGSSRS